MTSQTVTYETSSPPSTKHHKDSPDKVRSDGHRAARAGSVNQGLSAPPKKGTVGAGSAAATRTNRERLDGRTDRRIPRGGSWPDGADSPRRPCADPGALERTACDHHRWRLAGGCRYPPATTRRAVGDGGRADLPGCVRDYHTSLPTAAAMAPGRGKAGIVHITTRDLAATALPRRAPSPTLAASLPCTREGPPATANPPFGRGVVTRGGGDGVAGSNTRTPPWWWSTARAKT